PLVESFGYKGSSGVLVKQIMPNTPATGKLHEGDIITSLNGKTVETVQQLRNQIAATAPNSDVKLSLFREGKEQTVTLRLGEQPENMLVSNPGKGGAGSHQNMPEADAGKLGLRLAGPDG